MQFYKIKESLTPCTLNELGFDLVPEPPAEYHHYLAPGKRPENQYIAIVTPKEWDENRELFKMGIEIDPSALRINSTKAVVNFDSLTGTFLIPDRSSITEKSSGFSFALDERGIVFVDESGKVIEMAEAIRKSKRWKEPGIERFLYDFLELIVESDRTLMENYEKELDAIEDRVLAEDEKPGMSRINEIRGDMRELKVHYEQLIDMTQELEENENGFFNEDALRYLHLFMNRMLRLQDTAASVRDHALQVRDLYHTQLEVKQNRTMSLLTVVTTVFMPLTLITGWYGMNFKYMPELEMRWSYPVVLLVCIAIAVGCLVFFKKKKWM